MSTCPDCGSVQAVPKWDAWDALCQVPQKTQDELDRLRDVQAVARNLVQFGPHTGDENTVVVRIRVDLLNELADAIDREPHTAATGGR